MTNKQRLEEIMQKIRGLLPGFSDGAYGDVRWMIDTVVAQAVEIDRVETRRKTIKECIRAIEELPLDKHLCNHGDGDDTCFYTALTGAISAIEELHPLLPVDDNQPKQDE